MVWNYGPNLSKDKWKPPLPVEIPPEHLRQKAKDAKETAKGEEGYAVSILSYRVLEEYKKTAEEGRKIFKGFLKYTTTKAGIKLCTDGEDAAAMVDRAFSEYTGFINTILETARERRKYDLSHTAIAEIERTITVGYNFSRKVRDAVREGYRLILEGRREDIGKVLQGIKESAIATLALVMTYRPLIKSNEEIMGGYTD